VAVISYIKLLIAKSRITVTIGDTDCDGCKIQGDVSKEECTREMDQVAQLEWASAQLRELARHHGDATPAPVQRTQSMYDASTSSFADPHPALLQRTQSVYHAHTSSFADTHTLTEEHEWLARDKDDLGLLASSRSLRFTALDQRQAERRREDLLCAGFLLP
jgi:hypothetical protein